MAPHTSNWDFVIGRLAYFVINVKVRFLIKKEAFKPPFGGIFKSMGGIPVDRSKNNRMVDYVVGLFKNSESLYVVITPEGTRKPNPHWKKGFHYIAQKAGVPIALGFLDYSRKEGGVGKVMIPGVDVDKDLREIKEFYKDKKGRHPERFMLGLDEV